MATTVETALCAGFQIVVEVDHSLQGKETSENCCRPVHPVM